MRWAPLDVFIAGVHAGTLRQDGSGSLSFEYLPEYRGVPLSSSMDLASRVYHDSVVRPYLWGLLPEDSEARKAAVAGSGVSPNNPFAVLGVIGSDCPGAVQFVARRPDEAPDGDEDDPWAERLVPLDDAEIAARLADLRQGASGWILAGEHWSLGGQQGKFALRRTEDGWASCEGASATTHIFKSGVRGLSHQALNEYVCMRTAAACGLNTADVAFMEFRGEGGVEPAIVVQRYDRRVTDAGVERLHQEDLCQALSCLPENKYTMHGGPDAAAVLALLASTGAGSRHNVAAFLQALFFNYLIAGTDAHAKNYSLLLAADGNHRLAPIYDVASMAPYEPDPGAAHRPARLAMSIGGENRPGRVGMSQLERFVGQCGLVELGVTAQGCANLMSALAERIPPAMAEQFDELEATSAAPAARELRGRMEGAVARLCERSLARLG